MSSEERSPSLLHLIGDDASIYILPKYQNSVQFNRLMKFTGIANQIGRFAIDQSFFVEHVSNAAKEN